jgi:hypothetical protein
LLTAYRLKIFIIFFEGTGATPYWLINASTENKQRSLQITLTKKNCLLNTKKGVATTAANGLQQSRNSS